MLITKTMQNKLFFFPTTQQRNNRKTAKSTYSLLLTHTPYTHYYYYLLYSRSIRSKHVFFSPCDRRKWQRPFMTSSDWCVIISFPRGYSVQYNIKCEISLILPVFVFRAKVHRFHHRGYMAIHSHRIRQFEVLILLFTFFVLEFYFE